jgi:hypothetical protein
MARAKAAKQSAKKKNAVEATDASMPLFMALARAKAAEKAVERALQKSLSKKAKEAARAARKAAEAVAARRLVVDGSSLEGNGRQNCAFFRDSDTDESEDDEGSETGEDIVAPNAVRGLADAGELDEDEEGDEDSGFGVSFASKLSVQPSPLVVARAATRLPPALNLDGDDCSDDDDEPNEYARHAAVGGGKQQKKKGKNKTLRNARGGDAAESEPPRDDPKAAARAARDAKVAAKAAGKKQYAAFEARMLPKLAEANPQAKRRQVKLAWGSGGCLEGPLPSVHFAATLITC